ncbi:hypothetical protein HYW75_04470 [Candidatus Pacearchaeota archaeon]|nr:hypothetical protein [Candidatus Pacearchaeota archaeon]
MKNIREIKKGEMSLPVILSMIVAIFVLVLVGIFIYDVGTGKAIPFAKYLPDFMTKKDKVEGMEILRYQIIEDKVQYYDGTNWLDFKDGKVELEEKILTQSEVTEDFIKYYFYNKRENNDHLFVFLINRNPELDKDKGSLLIKNGDVTVVIKENKEQFVLDNKNEVYIVRRSEDVNVEHIILDNGDEIDVVVSSGGGFKLERVDSSAGLYNTIKDRAMAWRDSVLKKPIEIGFFVGDKEEIIRACVEKRGTDFIVDLLKESDSCG